MVLKLPKLNYKAPLKKKSKSLNKINPETSSKNEKENEENKPKYLEVTGANEDMDFSKIVENSAKEKYVYDDNPEVPMLEYG